MKNSTKYDVALRADWCKGCYFCIDVCPVAGIFTKSEQMGRKGFQEVVVNPDGCTGCMLCELLCPDLAITVGETDGVLTTKNTKNTKTDY